MKTKEAIELLEKDELLDEAIIKSYVALLQRGEKFEKMWKELDGGYGRHHHFYAITNERFCGGSEIIIHLSQTIKELEQKYFPK